MKLVVISQTFTSVKCQGIFGPCIDIWLRGCVKPRPAKETSNRHSPFKYIQGV